MATAESAGSDPNPHDKGQAIFCVDTGGNSSESKYGDYGDESASNKVQVLFIGGTDQPNTSTSVKEELYESDKLEEEKVGTDGVAIFFKGKPKQDHVEHRERSRSHVEFLE